MKQEQTRDQILSLKAKWSVATNEELLQSIHESGERIKLQHLKHGVSEESIAKVADKIDVKNLAPITKVIAKNSSDDEWVAFVSEGVLPELLPLTDAQMEAMKGGNFAGIGSFTVGLGTSLIIGASLGPIGMGVAAVSYSVGFGMGAGATYYCD